MKKRGFALALTLALILTGCKAGQRGPVPSEPPAAVFTAAEALAAVLASQPDGEGLERVEDDVAEAYLTSLYGLTAADVTDYAIAAASGADAREVAVLIPADSEAAERAERGLLGYLESRHADFEGYAPDEAALVEQGAVFRSGEVTALLICRDMDAAPDALVRLFKGGASLTQPVMPPLPADDTPAPETPEPSEEPLEPDPPIAEEPSDPPAPPEETPSLSPSEVKNFIPYHPPGLVEMIPYNTYFVRTAWETGDESGLSERDRAILARCKEAMAILTEDMTDFQKEAALYQWILDEVDSDPTAFDPGMPLGREDSDNPYGALVLGRAVCVGYANTFQLLMELAGVESRLILGAADWSRAEHAWNMVKLEGEWYCVDACWSNARTDKTGEALTRFRYKYFNVTSAVMRRTNHQWDYENTPEATAARFRWDGTGVMPE